MASVLAVSHRMRATQHYLLMSPGYKGMEFTNTIPARTRDQTVWVLFAYLNCPQGIHLENIAISKAWYYYILFL